ncbi:UvrD-helicase domain-containing protein [Stutzerimonas tarimensis]|uniref:UvrD-helicase domain-containing protein n=1 Tax=Stutzerimonas tarimensis TaxID=1507735 RepID=A0ABV7T6P4_9GAMM
MLSAVKRYRALLTATLRACFPRTSAYLREQHGSALSHAYPHPNAPLVSGATSRVKSKATAKARAKGAAKPRAKRAQPASEGIYGPSPLSVTTGQIQAMREQVKAAVGKGLLGEPSDEQWTMITCEHPVARVFAGAGSGKSSTLLLRVVFMLCHLKVAPERLTVISFTNASCAELRGKLVELLQFWSYPFDETSARRCVRTFHSAMGMMARQALGDPRWFEQSGRGRSGEPDDSLATGSAQRAVLKETYQSCYAENADFRERVHRLLGAPPPASGKPAGKAPLNLYRLPGEFRALPLFEAFQVQAGFAESIGLRPECLTGDGMSGVEEDFAEALALFWRSFNEQLAARGLMTFNHGFQQLTETLGDNGSSFGETALIPFSHLLIDEFQDISPQIVLWLQAAQRELTRRGQAVSLMAIGDDWQSIYGWRGSSPELFLDFDRHFPGKGRLKKSRVLRLETNYRSVAPVMEDAARMLAEVSCKQDKNCRAAKVTGPGDHGVKLVPGFDLRTGMDALLEEVTAQCSLRHTDEKTAVLLLSRGNDALKRIQARLDPALPVRALTIHRAKGLQAEVAIILDDCEPPPAHPFRNALYARSGFFRSSYDQAMRDETARLAYVAITRGASRVIWFTHNTQGAAGALVNRRS